MFATLAAAFLLVVTPSTDPVVCPIMGDKVDTKGPSVEFAGAKFWFCCGGCDTKFKSDPAKFLKAIADQKKVAGVYLFDPVTRERLDVDKAKGGFVDFNGVRYPFLSTADRTEFEREPAKFASVPKKESLHCAVLDETVAAPSKAAAYYDFEGVRYYLCCDGCKKPFATTPGKYAEQSKATVAELGVFVTPLDKGSENKGGVARSFECSHCGKTMKVQGEGDLQTKCKVCGCGVNAEFCEHKGGK